MNERIRELYEQALETKFDYSGGVGVKPGEYYSNYKTVLNAEKFAELLVRECAEVCKKQSFHYAEHNNKGSAASAADVCRILINQHFGVEE